MGSSLRGLVAALLCLVLVCAGACAPATPTLGTAATSPEPKADLALVNGKLIDGTGADPVSGAIVLISGGRIVGAGPADRVRVPPGTRTIDVGGRTILPGFINAHVHRAFDKTLLEAWARGGVTTVRDEGTSPGQVSGLRAFRSEVGGDPRYARLVSAGSMLAVPGGYGDLLVSSREDARQAVLNEIAQGVDEIKVALEDGYAGAQDLPKPTVEELSVMVQTAHANGLRVSGHITQGAYLQPMLDAGVDDIAHIPYDDVSSESLRKMVELGVYVTPTFTVFRNFGAPVDGCVGNLKRFIEMGGRVALGNDYGGGPLDFELGIPMYEIEMMSRAGMSPMQIIEASTLNAARVVDLGEDLGSIQTGKAADILVVDGDPLSDLGALAQVRLVVHDGIVIREEGE